MGELGGRRQRQLLNQQLAHVDKSLRCKGKKRTVLHIHLILTEYIIDQQCPTKPEHIAGQNIREYISDQVL